MTARFAEHLEKGPPRVDFGGPEPYGVIRGPFHLNPGWGDGYHHSVNAHPKRATPSGVRKGSKSTCKHEIAMPSWYARGAS